MARTKQTARKTAQGGLGKGKGKEKLPPAIQASQQTQRRRRHWSTNALQEIKRYQKSKNLLIPKMPFARLVREITETVASHPMRFQVSALGALQEAAEAFLVKGFEMTNLAAIHVHRVTIQPRDMKFVEHLRDIMTELPKKQ